MFLSARVCILYGRVKYTKPHVERCNVIELTMVNVKTKYNKHAEDNERRRQSVKKREKAKLNQSQIIKNALSNSTLNSSNKKVVFSDDENRTDTEGDESVVHREKNLNGNEKSALFESSESENEDFEIREKTQFVGKKGFELLNLQSTYGNDERFKIDERFFEDEKDNFENEIIAQNGEENFSEEKAKQLKILGSVLGTPDPEPEESQKKKKRTYDMIRYDATKKEHEIYEIKTPNESVPVSLKKTSKKKEKRPKTDTDNLSKPVVLKEKYYEVSDKIKSCFKEKQTDGHFSLLQTYGSNNVVENEDKKAESDKYSEDEFEEVVNEKKENLKDDKKVMDTSAVVAEGIWKEPFFFSEDDNRFKEALEFINKKNSDEAVDACKNYDKTRRKLKEILRLYLKKRMQSKNPFKNKIGGMNKKQLVNLKYKNSKAKFNRREPKKKSLGGKT